MKSNVTKRSNRTVEQTKSHIAFEVINNHLAEHNMLRSKHGHSEGFWTHTNKI